MDFLNKSFAQLSDLFRSMTAGARITAALLLGVLVVSLVFLFRGQGSGPEDYLFGGRQVATEAMQGQMIKAFGEASLRDYQFEGAQVRVPHGQATIYEAALAKGGALPATFGSALERAFNSSSPFTSSSLQVERNNLARAQELSRSLSMMGGVDWANVLFTTKRENGFSRSSTTTATVMVKGVGSQPLDDQLVQSIRNSVAGGLAARTEDITITDVNASRSYTGGAGGGLPSGVSDAYRDRKASYERSWTDTIQRQLSYIQGALVSVNVQLTNDLENVESSTEFDPKPVPVEVSSTTSSNSTQGPAPQGRPGLAGQGAIPNTGAQIGSGGGPRSDEKSKEHQERNVVSQRRQEKRLAGLIPKNVAVTIGVPSSYINRIWSERNPTEPGAEPKKADPAALAAIEQEAKDKILGQVAKLIPIPAATDPKSLIDVAVFSETPVPKMIEPSLADTGLVWLSVHWTTVGTVLFAIVALLMLRSMIRSAPIVTGPQVVLQGLNFPSSTGSDSSSGVSNSRDDSPPPPTRTRKRGITGPSLRDELVDIVRDDPDAAAAILRNWIGNAT